MPEPAKNPEKRYVPAMSHPWKSGEFFEHVSAQQHREITDGMTHEDLWYTQADSS